MQRPGHRNVLVVGARRRALLDELRGAQTPIHLCAPAGYGKTTFAQMLRAGGAGAPPQERRALRAPAASETIVVGAHQLALDPQEIAQIFSPAKLAERDLEQIEHLTQGWPAGVLYLLRMHRLGVLKHALNDLDHPAFDDLFDYIECNVYRPATRAQRLWLLVGEDGFAQHPLVRAALQVRHAQELASVRRHRAASALRTGRFAEAARWFLAAQDSDSAVEALATSSEVRDDITAALPFASLQRRPHVWLRGCEARLRAIGALAFAAEAAAIVKAFEQQGHAAESARASLWLALGHARSGNIAAALTVRERAMPLLAKGEAQKELALLRSALSTERANTAQEANHCAPSESCVRIELFSGKVMLGDDEIRLPHREAAVLFTLAAHPQRSTESKRLALAIWPDLDAEQARAAMKVTVTRLRSRLGRGAFVRFAGGNYVLSDEVGVDLTDLDNALHTYAIDASIEDVERFKRVLSAYRPPRLRDAPWFGHIESALVRSAHRLADVLAEHAARRGDAAALREIGAALLASDAGDEQGCLLLLRSHVMEGNLAAARAEYERFAQRLRDDLACDPSFSFESVLGAALA